jgi:hypothetical protein
MLYLVLANVYLKKKKVLANISMVSGNFMLHGKPTLYKSPDGKIQVTAGTDNTLLCLFPEKLIFIIIWIIKNIYF